MPRLLHIRRVRSQNIKFSKRKNLAKPSMLGGALKKHLKENDDFHTNLGMLRHSPKSLNISRPKPKNRYIHF